MASEEEQDSTNMWSASLSKLHQFPSLRIVSRRYFGDKKKVLAIRREDVNVWERRAPLSPAHVKQLVKDGIKVIVQPSNRRAYSMMEYVQAGADYQEEINEASLILGVKQIPIDLLLPDKTYAFFSHTIKAQEENMPLLDALLEKNIRLIDYERILDSKGQRLVAFGKYAGVSGMINILHGLGLRLLALGHQTPFMHIGASHNYRSSQMALQAIRDAGYEIALGRMPKSIGPLTFIFTGSGNVSQGAQEVFQELPFEYIEPEHLPKVVQQGVTNKLYACVVSREDHFVRKDEGSFDAEEFEVHPERYISVFSHKIAPYASCIVNGIYWSVNTPRLITIPDAKNLLKPAATPWLSSMQGCPLLPHRLLAICDISADPGGSIEFMKECTTIDRPFCLYDAEQHMETESFAGDGVLICSISNMPAQIPREATDFFGGQLLPHVYDMVESNAKKLFEDYNVSPAVKNSVITSNGQLTPNFKYIEDLRNKFRSAKKAKLLSSSITKKCLLLGAGYVSTPVVEYLTRDKTCHMTVASQLKEDLDIVSELNPNIDCVILDINRNREELENLVQEHDVVISLLPFIYHPEIAKVCIANQKNMVTASYVSPAMRELHQEAVNAGVTIVNEVGVDPGIDHMLAMECFDEVRTAGGKINSFTSWCGGLPAPEFSDCPLRYKFSWSPRGVLLNLLAGAKYLEKGKEIEIESGGTLLDVVRKLDFLPGFNIEGFPNRDSTAYIDRYDIGDAQTCVRGTIRYNGFSNSAKALLQLGLLQSRECPHLHENGPPITWKAYMCELMGKSPDILVDSLRDLIYGRLECNAERLAFIEDLGLLEEELIDKRGSPLDTISNYLAKRLSYQKGERDVLLMRHQIEFTWPDKTRVLRNIGLCVYGDSNGASAMAKTVGLPCAIATKMVLESEIQKKGIVVPLSPDIYSPILKRLKQEGICATESEINLN
ncbi:alpha-aminoadipic semialdehyde synthase, mitochondrial isoform X2 [Octopus sinensis]|uniref:Alpha-aminoadipic semialdehyde synthase, mitochondrial isoform X2 n=1 Tax=Octopus sinensis TaxID=2607531 RepID=A0A7E6ENQ8_9MOLL|nr:alpha-aminoadipic semialdehyde synthase, mitochondrial isoform X2 [Octopus sinensis]